MSSFPLSSLPALPDFPAGAFILTGTDTGIGKTVAAALLTLGLEGCYYKPVQSGTEEETDRQAVRRMTGLGDDRILAEGLTLARPLSPHYSAELEGVEIDPARLTPPPCPSRPLIIEGAGGLMVPLRRDLLLIDLFAAWKLPVVLVARTGLGTINHSLLSLEALRTRGLDVAGMVFSGEAHPDNPATVCALGEVPCLGYIPLLPEITPDSLRVVLASSVDLTPLKECIA